MTPIDDLVPAPGRIKRRAVAAWGLWDWGSSAFNAVVVSFVFGPYLVRGVGGNAPAGAVDPSTQLAISTACAGVVIAVLAPVTGQRTDAGGRRKLALAVWTGLVVLTMLAMFSVKADYSYLLLGLVLLGVGSIFAELAGVSYNAMLHQVSTPATIGRVSGLGWSMGYFGGIFLLLICYVGFIHPDVGWFGVTSAEGLSFRAVVVFSALWFAVFAVPLFLAVPEVPPGARGRRVGMIESYRVLVGDLRALWAADRNAVRFLIASALFRDGLNSIFSFGPILAVSVYGMAQGNVLIFGVVANVVAAVGALSLGIIEDRVGPKRIIIVSLVALITTAMILLFSSGLTLFWIFGLVLSLWVGPAQASSRSFMARVAPVGREGQFFGLYATTGRAVSWLAPALFAIISAIAGAAGYAQPARLGIIGIAVVLAAGLVALLRVHPPRSSTLPSGPAPATEPETLR